MRAIEIQTFGEPKVMQLVEKNDPVPSTGEVLVRVYAAGVNPVETYIRAGTYPILPELPYTPGGNVAGVIEKCGQNSGEWKEGDRVYSSATLTGAYAEKCLCHADQIFRLPESLSFSQGASLGVPAATAWRGLFIRGGAIKGEKVLIHGASGSVGQAATQLAAGYGLEVFGTAGSSRGGAIIEKFGGKFFNHNAPDYEKDLLASVTGEGFDLILEMLANENLEKDLGLLAPGGRVVVIGSRGRIEIDPRAIMGKETDIRGLAVFKATPEETRATHQGLAKAIDDGHFFPAVSLEMQLSEAPRAHELVMKDGNCGKIVLIP
jgi:NADPH2:quinone reductase